MAQKFRRRPKGSGTVYKLSGNRRKPYAAAVTVGSDPITGAQKQPPIGYFATRAEALDALTLYNLNMGEYQTQGLRATFEEIWENVLEKELSDLDAGTIRNYSFGYRDLSEIHHRYINELKLKDIQPIFDNLIKNGAGKGKVNFAKVVLSKTYNYAMRYEYCNKDYSKLIKAKAKKKEKPKVAFSHKQIKWLFENDVDLVVQSILVMIYTGLRPSEFLNIRKEDINLENSYMTGGMKTEAGKNRIIPIHNCIKSYIVNMIKNKTEYLFSCNGKHMTNGTYTYYFNRVIAVNKWEQSPHCGRHTFLTLAHEFGLNELKVKRIVGHVAFDITKDVYTHIQIDELIKEIEKLPKIC